MSETTIALFNGVLTLALMLMGAWGGLFTHALVAYRRKVIFLCTIGAVGSLSIFLGWRQAQNNAESQDKAAKAQAEATAAQQRMTGLLDEIAKQSSQIAAQQETIRQQNERIEKQGLRPIEVRIPAQRWDERDRTVTIDKEKAAREQAEAARLLAIRTRLAELLREGEAIKAMLKKAEVDGWIAKVATYLDQSLEPSYGARFVSVAVVRGAGGRGSVPSGAFKTYEDPAASDLRDRMEARLAALRQFITELR
jgi:hypothetical protein